ncbi:hypothetical protein NEOLEDRAFT_1173404 [Neolentinus lepideus HHB14362 ss-1]|uniref:Nucleotide exchange factor SIL1 n=1 Tax=Neolentinus lepideus HHB14362 ss-1 TaxID=1314782 RepID=A0A165MTK7_9AGAM|nr:hypothetical protein NEOLEDRAFT_1173404 [Neolentinus lepideus HHB14362 ss-1]
MAELKSLSRHVLACSLSFLLFSFLCMLSLDDMMNRQSSPPPSFPLSDEQQSTSELSPTPESLRVTPATANRKRGSEDLLSKDQRTVWSAATLLCIQNSVSLLHPPEAWTMQETLKKKIDVYSAAIILSPKLSAYVTGNVARDTLVQVLKRHPSWGFTQEVREAPAQNDAVLALISAKLTDRRYSVKKMIADSLGTASEDSEYARRNNSVDIITLCNMLATKVFKRAKVVVTVPMCGRIAFLRQVYYEHPDAGDKYWSTMDRCLREFREKFPDEARLSSAIGLILTQDRKVYGSEDTDLDAVMANAGTLQQVQRESEDVIAGVDSNTTPTNEAQDDSSDDE